MANPSDVFAVDDLRVLTGSPIIAALAEPQQLLETLDRAYRHARVESSLGDATTDTTPAIETSIADDPVTDGPMVRLVEALLEQAAKDKASDLHIEPTTDKVIIRLRIDGVLHDTSEAPLSVLRPMVSRLKVLSGLDIAQSRLPQDGRFSTTLQGRPVDVRVATIPTVTGEGMVLRMLDTSRGVIDLPSLGLSATELARFEPAFRAAQGGVFVTGPTGSGKTSTLYAALSAISTRDKSIVSVEDPVEYRLYGVRQIQAHAEGRSHVPGRAALDPARRPRRDLRRRGPGRGDRPHGRRGRDHRAPRALEPAHDARRPPRRSGSSTWASSRTSSPRR